VTTSEGSSGGAATTTTGETPTSGGGAGTTTGSESSGGESTVGTTTSGTTSEGMTTTGDPMSGDTSTGEPVDVDIEAALSRVDGLTWEEMDSQFPGYRYFMLYLQQPADHDDPDGLQFIHRMQLFHRHAAAPMVIDTEGYGVYPESQAMSEPAAMLRANQLVVEHRWFGTSRPEPADWSLLSIEQAAADHHRIRTILGDAIYGGPWVSTGISKGGMTASYYRRFYPDDVVATIAYVAPITFVELEKHYWQFLGAIKPACNASLTNFRRELLLRRQAMLGRVVGEAMMQGYDYEIVGEERALEVTALKFGWTFWQRGLGDMCPDVPTANATDDQLWSFLQAVRPVYWMADEFTAELEPYYWQVASQLGTARTDETALADLLIYPGFDTPLSYIEPGIGKAPWYTPEPMLAVQAWVTDEADAMLFVYGERDPWTAGAYAVNPEHDVHRLVVAGGSHSASIDMLAPADRELAYERIEAWTGVTPIAAPGTPRPWAAMLP